MTAPETYVPNGSLRFDVAQRGDALELLQSLPDRSAAVVHFDPQHRSNLNQLKYGNEGVRQRERCALPQMSDEYIDQCCREAARVLRPSGYLPIWADTFRLCRADHLRVADVLPCVDLISWNSEKRGQGYRTGRYGGYLLILQKKPKEPRGRHGPIAAFPITGPKKSIARFTRTFRVDSLRASSPRSPSLAISWSTPPLAALSCWTSANA
jgi:hypothetical protein